MSGGWLAAVLLLAATCGSTGVAEGLPTGAAGAEGAKQTSPHTTTVAREAGYGSLPLHFEANRGQADAEVRFLARGNGYALFLTSTEAVLVLREPAPAHRRPRVTSEMARAREPHALAAVHAVRMRLVASLPSPEVTGDDPLPGRANDFLGDDPTKWRTGIPLYARVVYRDVYPGVSLVHYGRQRQLEYDFVVAPGADPRVIQLALDGADGARLDSEGNILIRVAGGELRLDRPAIYQEIGAVQSTFGGDTDGFVAKPDPAGAPIYSTYPGGSGADGASVVVDTGTRAIAATTPPHRLQRTPRGAGGGVPEIVR